MREPADANGKPSIYMPYGASGGGGAGGNYVFTDLAHLDSIIGKWETVHQGIARDGQKIERAAEHVGPPADDDPSVNQATTAQESLRVGWEHNQRMLDYAESYIDRLRATRAEYSGTEQGNTDRFRNVDGD